ncbi:PTS sugar transporter subunit IIA [Escherichia sp. E3659]|uniref:PTS sugar transporter subunit IIA n=1 Tax=Escherichia sp. E3659 TaxID=2044462 RepID=UPI0010804D04|nr:PTS sugar transporter subunit IIA [Escherichia sp. E3659]TGB83689.1 PTS galactitol transporter subunit IIA [Escherichia sp. E3659]TLJ14399.1 PTS sugar transporter subunit IIA [Escherichia sp. E3659]
MKVINQSSTNIIKFTEELVFLNQQFADSDDFFLKASEKFLAANLVTSNFPHRIALRESEYPTGLVLNPFSIAIPHTDTEFVKEPFIAFYQLADQMCWNEMGADENKIKVKFIILLGLVDTSSHIDFLQNLITLFSTENHAYWLSETQSSHDATNYLNKYI